MKLSTAAYTYVTERTRRRELTGFSPRNYRTALVAFANAVGDPDVSRLKRQHVEDWMASQTQVTTATLRCYFTTVRGFSRWAVQRGLLRHDPTADLKAPREPRRLVRALKPAQVATVHSGCPDARARVVWSLCVQEGLRIGEVARLDVGDVDLAERTVLVRHGKGGHQRPLPLSEETREAIVAYLMEHPAGNGPLIRSYLSPGRGLTGRYLSQLVSDWTRAAGVHQRPWDGLTAHTLAHAVLERTGDVRDVQAALGTPCRPRAGSTSGRRSTSAGCGRRWAAGGTGGRLMPPERRARAPDGA